jgi:hypothetical protein
MNKLISAALLGIAAVGIVGCGGVDSVTGANDPKVRFVNATPALGFNVDATLGNDTLAQNMAYGVPTAYRRVGNGNREIVVRQTGSNNVLYQSEPDPLFEENNKYTVVAVQGATSVGALVLEDGATAPPVNNAKLRVIHAANGTGNVDVYLAPTGGALPAAPVMSNVSYLGNTAGYITAPAGTFDFRITATGSTTALLSQTITLPSQGVRTVIVLDNPAGTTPSSILVLDDNT